MATLEKIRSKGVLLLVVVGMALLAFIIGDFLNSGATYFNQSREVVAEIAGEDVHINDYAASIEQMMEVYKMETGQMDLDEQTTAQLRTSVWEALVNEKILNKEAAKLGLLVSADELWERCTGANVHPIIAQRRAFADETGRFNAMALTQFLNSLDIDPQNQQMADQIKSAKSYWMFWENNLRITLLQEKYNTLIAKAVTANSLEAKLNFDMNQSKVDVEYVMQPYYAVADSLVKVSESEMKKLYSARKETFKQEPNRDLEYIAFNIVPSEQDFAEAEAWINNLKAEFTTTTDIAGLVNSNSDVMYDGHNYSEKSVPARYAEFAFSGKKGDVTDVIFADETYSMARIVESGLMVSDSVRLRHILIENNEERADSIVTAIKRGADFSALALKYSLVQETALNGGEIGWVQEQELPKEMATPAFAKRAKDVFKVSTMGQGIQIVQIIEKSKATPKVKLAIMERKVTPSSQTYGQLYNDAKRYVVENNTAEKFNAAAAEKGLVVMPAIGITKNAQQVARLSTSREIVRWAFNSEKGDVSDVFECGDAFVVALVRETKDDDFRPIGDVAFELRAELLKEKKGELIQKQMEEALAGQNTLEAAAAFVKDDVQKVEAMNFDSYQFGAAGIEPYMIGAAAVMSENTVSKPLQGNTGVFVLRTANKQSSEAEFDQAAQIQALNMRSSYYLPYQLTESLRNDAEIMDNRSMFY